VHAEGIAVAHGAKAGRDGGGDAVTATVFTLPTENSNPLASWIAAAWLPKKARRSLWIDRAGVV